MIGERLIKLRKAKKLTQTDLAELCGVSRNSIVNWETEKSEPKISDIQKLAKILDASLNDLIGQEVPLISAQSQLAPKNIPSESESFAYWGGVLDKTRKVAERGDIQEIDVIAPLLQSALNMLLSVKEHFQTASNVGSASIFAYSGDNSSYAGNTLNLGKAIA
jgi:transcriptional regulator with XRE-family HTH domain